MGVDMGYISMLIKPVWPHSLTEIIYREITLVSLIPLLQGGLKTVRSITYASYENNDIIYNFLLARHVHQLK